MKIVQKFMNFYKLFNKYKRSILSLGIIFVVLVFTNKLLLKDVVYESDDYKLHAVRLANYYLALKQGQIPVRWGPNLNNGYGYPSFNYMYHTPYFLGSIIHSVGFSVQESLNLSVLFSLLVGAMGCYFLIRFYLKSELRSIFLSLFFILNPYTLLNIYWRGAIGELLFYFLTPFFILGIKKILENDKQYLYFLLTVISTAILILSHLPSIALLFFMLVFFIAAESKEGFLLKKYALIVYAIIFGFLLTVWYWLPAYFEQWMINYQDAGSLTQYLSQFVYLPLIFNVWKTVHSSNYFLDVLQIGAIPLLALIIGVYLMRFTKKISYWLLLVVFSIFLLSSFSKFLWDSNKILQYIQFPWRFLWLITFSSIMIFVAFFSEKKINNKWKNYVAVLLVIGVFYSSQTYIASKGITNRLDFDWYHPTNETGSSLNEHLPVWANASYYFPDELLYVESSQAASLELDNLNINIHKLSELNPKILMFDGKKISYRINPVVEVIVLHKRLFYPGWEARLDGKKVDFIENIPEYRGILALSIPNKESLVEIEFTGYTKLRRFSEVISLTTMLFLIGQFILKKCKIKK